MTKICTDEKFYPKKIFSDEVFSDKVVRLHRIHFSVRQTNFTDLRFGVLVLELTAVSTVPGNIAPLSRWKPFTEFYEIRRSFCRVSIVFHRVGIDRATETGFFLEREPVAQLMVFTHTRSVQGYKYVIYIKINSIYCI